ncbi:36415_t:CDS:2, partial [Racocetra persica]
AHVFHERLTHTMLITLENGELTLSSLPICHSFVIPPVYVIDTPDITTEGMIEYAEILRRRLTVGTKVISSVWDPDNEQNVKISNKYRQMELDYNMVMKTDLVDFEDTPTGDECTQASDAQQPEIANVIDGAYEK